MELPIQITFRGMAHSAALEAAIREKASKLGQFHQHLMSCRAVIETAARHKHQGKEFVVRLDIKVAGGGFAINREHSEDPFVALRDAFDAARRKLGHARRERGDVNPLAPNAFLAARMLRDGAHRGRGRSARGQTGGLRAGRPRR